jgi:hypothetical protein
MPSEKRHKTYKREAAIVLLTGLGGVIYTGDIEMVQVLVWPILGFAAAAFGMDSIAAQWGDK